MEDLREVPPLVDRVAPEHLELAIGGAGAEALMAEIRNAGAIFLGAWTPEAIGDYVSGSNHVLPTARSARFSSGLGVLDFMKRTSILRLTEKSLAALGPAAMTLAAAEGASETQPAQSEEVESAAQPEPSTDQQVNTTTLDVAEDQVPVETADSGTS